MRETIERNKPILSLSGHIHEARSIDEIGKTKVVNPGPISDGYATEIIFQEGIRINLLESRG